MQTGVEETIYGKTGDGGDLSPPSPRTTSFAAGAHDAVKSDDDESFASEGEGQRFGVGRDPNAPSSPEMPVEGSDDDNGLSEVLCPTLPSFRGETLPPAAGLDTSPPLLLKGDHAAEGIGGGRKVGDGSAWEDEDAGSEGGREAEASGIDAGGEGGEDVNEGAPKIETSRTKRSVDPGMVYNMVTMEPSLPPKKKRMTETNQQEGRQEDLKEDVTPAAGKNNTMKMPSQPSEWTATMGTTSFPNSAPALMMANQAAIMQQQQAMANKQMEHGEPAIATAMNTDEDETEPTSEKPPNSKAAAKDDLEQSHSDKEAMARTSEGETALAVGGEKAVDEAEEEAQKQAPPKGFISLKEHRRLLALTANDLMANLQRENQHLAIELDHLRAQLIMVNENQGMSSQKTGSEIVSLKERLEKAKENQARGYIKAEKEILHLRDRLEKQKQKTQEESQKYEKAKKELREMRRTSNFNRGTKLQVPGDEDQPSNKWDQKWDRKYEMLKRFKAEYGHVNCSSYFHGSSDVYPGLAAWISTQRGDFAKLKAGKKSCITPLRMKRLNDIGFDWQPTGQDWIGFEQRIPQLQAFKDKFGHTNVQQKYKETTGLGNWVLSMRRQYRQGKLPQSKIAVLESMGFQWRLRAVKVPGGRHRRPQEIVDLGNRIVDLGSRHHLDDISTAGGRGPGDMRPVDMRPGDMQPGDMRPGDMRPGDMRPGDMLPGDMRPGDMRPGDMRPGDMRPGDMRPGDMRPGDML